jgi:hypothetical protein
MWFLIVFCCAFIHYYLIHLIGLILFFKELYSDEVRTYFIAEIARYQAVFIIGKEAIDSIGIQIIHFSLES